jgi:hypothetical protein
MDRDKGPETSPEVQRDHGGDEARAKKPANSVLVAENREISVSVGVRGGLERTQTIEQVSDATGIVRITGRPRRTRTCLLSAAALASGKPNFQQQRQTLKNAKTRSPETDSARCSVRKPLIS